MPFKVTNCEFIERNGTITFKMKYQANLEGTEFLHVRTSFDGPVDFFYIDEIECAEPGQDANAQFQC